MATDHLRPIIKMDFAHIIEIPAGGTCTAGMSVHFNAADTIVDAGATDDDAIGICLGNVGQTFTTGDRVRVGLAGPVYRAKCGTGGTTRGKKQKPVADGFTDAPAHDSSGATDGVISGIALESALVGDYFGMIYLPFNRGSA